MRQTYRSSNLLPPCFAAALGGRTDATYAHLMRAVGDDTSAGWRICARANQAELNCLRIALNDMFIRVDFSI